MPAIAVVSDFVGLNGALCARESKTADEPAGGTAAGRPPSVATWRAVAALAVLVMAAARTMTAGSASRRLRMVAPRTCKGTGPWATDLPRANRGRAEHNHRNRTSKDSYAQRRAKTDTRLSQLARPDQGGAIHCAHGRRRRDAVPVRQLEYWTSTPAKAGPRTPMLWSQSTPRPVKTRCAG